MPHRTGRDVPRGHSSCATGDHSQLLNILGPVGAGGSLGLSSQSQEALLWPQAAASCAPCPVHPSQGPGQPLSSRGRPEITQTLPVPRSLPSLWAQHFLQCGEQRKRENGEKMNHLENEKQEG